MYKPGVRGVFVECRKLDGNLIMDSERMTMMIKNGKLEQLKNKEKG